MQMLTAKPRAPFRATSSIIAACVVGSSCVGKDDLAVWKAEVASPDGRWVATADTVQNGGFGSAHIATTVYLRRTGDSRPPVTVLEFSCPGPLPRPYTLDNVANAGGSIHLAVKWIDSSHLHITYDAHPDLIFQAVKLQDVTITAEDLAAAAGEKRT